MRLFWIQSKSLACGGPRPSGNITNSAVVSLPFRCARILSINAGSSMGLSCVLRIYNDTRYTCYSGYSLQ